MDWISQHHDSLTALTSIGTLLIWLVYAQLLYKGYRRQRRPRLIINRGKRKDINALCIISNMSAEPVFIEYIVAELETSRGSIVMDVTDFERDYFERGYGDQGEGDEQHEPDEIPDRVRDNTRQGPVQPGDFLHIGTFQNIVRRMARQAKIEMQGFLPAGDLEFERLTIQLIGIYGPEDLPMGAERSFTLRAKGEQCDLAPQTWDTKHKNSRRQRHRLRDKLEQLNRSPFTVSPTLQESN
ncbi:hypothetical protein [Marinobacter similis]|uniref:Uncharacterized protein n=1 Tax=Marinobacter similis TaxID=1420916 RepID=W5YGU0_9GAMM|nr:hypothetical protein [Marinobacter similis]AHI28296.1 hypothetical protein AU14_05705 [Marinobacter similis]